MSRVNDQRICLVSHAPFVSGAEIAFENLAHGLRDAGHDVHLVLGHRHEFLERLTASGFACDYVPMPPPRQRTRFGYWNSLRKLRKIIRRVRPWLVHSNDLPTHQFTSTAARGLPVKVICHHRAMFDAPGIAWFNKHGADQHLFVSEAHLRELTTIAPTLHEQNPAVAHDGIPLPPCPTPEERHAAKVQLGLPTEKRIVLFVGQMTAIKGVITLLQAWSQLAPEVREQAQLVLVGEDLQKAGAYRREMEALGERLGCQAKFVGFQKRVQPWWCAADIGAVSSTVEPFGLVNVEAMAHGLPVVGTQIGGIPEIVAHNETGLLVPAEQPARFAEALTALIRDPQRCAVMGHAGRARAEAHFSVAAHVQRVLTIYDEMRETPSRLLEVATS